MEESAEKDLVLLTTLKSGDPSRHFFLVFPVAFAEFFHKTGFLNQYNIEVIEYLHHKRIDQDADRFEIDCYA